MKIIYISGPYKGITRADVVANLYKAAQAVQDVYYHDAIGIYTPLMTDWFAGEYNEKHMLKKDLEFIKVCDAVYVLEGWQESTGATTEVEYAKSINIPVFDSLGSLEVFLKAKSKSQMKRLACQLGAKSLDGPEE